MTDRKLYVISTETLAQFVERVGGEVHVASIASRFGWDVERAKMMIRNYHNAGVVVSSGDYVSVASLFKKTGYVGVR